MGGKQQHSGGTARMNGLKVFAGRASRALAQAICQELRVPLGAADIFKFANDNTFVQITESVRNQDVYVIQTSCPPVDENLMELLMLIDALRSSSAGHITAVLPYYPYARSDKRDQPRIAVTARLVADLITTAGANRVITLDLHAPQIQGFFRMPSDHLTAMRLLAEYFITKGLERPVVVAGDAGRAKHAMAFARRIGAPAAIMEKQRVGNTDRIEVLGLIGEVKGRQAILIDDEISTGGTLAGAVQALRELGAREVYAACVHPVLAGPAPQRLGAAGLTELVVTDTVPVPPEKIQAIGRVTVLPVAPLLAEAIRRIHRGDSTSELK